MTLLSQYSTLFAFHWHTISQVLDLAGSLSADDYRQGLPDGQRSVHELLFHILRTDWAWRQGLETGGRPPPLEQSNFPDLAALKNGFAAEQQAWQSLLDGLEPGEIESEVSLASRRNVESISRWRIFQHLVLHGMQHQAELALYLTQKGFSPGDIDFIFFE